MRAILICPNGELRSNFEKSASCHSAIRITRSVDHYPAADELRRFVRMWGPNVIFMSMEDPAEVGRISKLFDAEFSSIQRIALSTVEEVSTFRLALQLRMTELLVPPFDDNRFVAILKRLADHIQQHPSGAGNPGEVYAFMPAKGGAGASTIAANAAWAFAEVPGSSVLLADFDVSSGVAGFLFGTDHDYSVNDAAKMNKELDGETWQRLVKKAGKIDLLLSGAPMLDEGISAQQVQPLLDYARRNYSVIGADTSDTFDDCSLAVLREANRIFLVTTPDLVSLRLAKLKILALRKLELEEKTSLLLNRTTRRMELSLDEVETTLGLPVFATFPCDYADVTRATRKGHASPNLAPSVKKFVEKLNERRPEEKKRARFIERFALVPGRYGFR